MVAYHVLASVPVTGLTAQGTSTDTLLPVKVLRGMGHDLTPLVAVGLKSTSRCVQGWGDPVSTEPR